MPEASHRASRWPAVLCGREAALVPFADDLGRPWKDRTPRLARKATIDFSAVYRRLQPLGAPAKHEKRGLRLTEMPMHAAVVFPAQHLEPHRLGIGDRGQYEVASDVWTLEWLGVGRRGETEEENRRQQLTFHAILVLRFRCGIRMEQLIRTASWPNSSRSPVAAAGRRRCRARPPPRRPRPPPPPLAEHSAAARPDSWSR